MVWNCKECGTRFEGGEVDNCPHCKATERFVDRILTGKLIQVEEYLPQEVDDGSNWGY